MSPKDLMKLYMKLLDVHSDAIQLQAEAPNDTVPNRMVDTLEEVLAFCVLHDVNEEIENEARRSYETP
tara:strand:+ start:819 stop:1022 length:204 start_codon:yes stop_codon:yes gene_type:complete